jgi:pimeloyl-ACP methyl ester carboxylesterase
VSGLYRPEDYVDDIITFIKNHFDEPVSLLGHSLGGWVALMVAAQLKTKIHALILGDPPLNMERFVAIESSEARVQMWRMMRDLVISDLSVKKLAEKLGNLPVSGSDPDGPSRYADLPGGDAASFRAWAKTLKLVDPDAAMYHAEGRITEYIENMDIETDLQTLTCPMLLVQGNPSKGGLVTDADAEEAVTLAADGICIRLDGFGHDLGLSSWNVQPLLRAITNFLESL